MDDPPGGGDMDRLPAFPQSLPKDVATRKELPTKENRVGAATEQLPVGKLTAASGRGCLLNWSSNTHLTFVRGSYNSGSHVCLRTLQNQYIRVKQDVRGR